MSIKLQAWPIKLYSEFCMEPVKSIQSRIKLILFTRCCNRHPPEFRMNSKSMRNLLRQPDNRDFKWQMHALFLHVLQDRLQAYASNCFYESSIKNLNQRLNEVIVTPFATWFTEGSHHCVHCSALTSRTRHFY